MRWVQNKESHAQKIITTMADYFLTQRVKPSQEDYADRLAKHHAVILAAMKAKQKLLMKRALLRLRKQSKLWKYTTQNLIIITKHTQRSADGRS